MDPITAITLGKQLLKLTGLDDKIGDWIDDKTGGSASKVVEIAETVIGGKLDDRERLSSAEKAEIKRQLLASESEIRQLAAADRKSARDMYTAERGSRDMADHIAKRVIEWNLPMILLLVIANAVALWQIKDATIGVAVGNAIGASISALWFERRTVIEFFFGSSQGSKDKTAAMSRAK